MGPYAIRKIPSWRDDNPCIRCASYAFEGCQRKDLGIILNVSINIPIHIILAHGKPETLHILQAIIEAIGHRLLAVVESNEALKRSILQENPQLIISGVEFADGDGIETLVELSDVCAIPAIIIAREIDLERVERAMDDHVMAYLVDPITAEDLKPTILLVMRRFEEFESLRQENEELKEALASRKLVERAKGIIMGARQMSEEDAYLHLRGLATRNQLKLGQVAKLVIDSQDID